MADEPTAAAGVGDSQVAFVTGVFVRFQLSLLRYLRQLLVRREDAEDVAQETYLRLVSAAALDRSEMRVRAFMFKAATNLAYDRFRQRRSRGQHDDGALGALPADTPPAESVVELEQALRVVESTVLGLPPRCRQVFLLRTSHECSYEEIADRLNISKRTVEREMQAALDACQRGLRGGALP
jgi:RNA polymerase sigma-70 factor (ECF subfamily)